MSLPELHKIRITLVGLLRTDGAVVKEIESMLIRDRADEHAEQGGTIPIPLAGGGMELNTIPSDVRDDLRWRPPPSASLVDAMLAYHAHPHYLAEIGSGPSGASSLSGDRGATRYLHQDSLIFTPQADGTFNVDFLAGRFEGPSVDLGNFGPAA